MVAMLEDAVRLGKGPRKITPPLDVLFLGLLLGHECFSLADLLRTVFSSPVNDVTLNAYQA